MRWSCRITNVVWQFAPQAASLLSMPCTFWVTRRFPKISLSRIQRKQKVTIRVTCLSTDMQGGPESAERPQIQAHRSCLIAHRNGDQHAELPVRAGLPCTVLSRSKKGNAMKN